MVSNDGLKLLSWSTSLNDYELNTKKYRNEIADLPVGVEEWMSASVDWDTTQGTIIKILIAGCKLAKMRSKNQRWIG